MKIFNVENGIEKVYVQMSDIGFLDSSDMPIPSTIYMKVFGSGVTIIDEYSRMNFICFDIPSEIEYFKELDFILDYKDYIKLSQEELEAKGQELLNMQIKISEKYNSMSDEEKEANQELVQDFEKLNYMLLYIQEFYWLKIGEKTMPFPQVLSSYGFKFTGDENLYEMSASLDPNIFYFYRKDGKPMTKKDKIPEDFYQMGLSLAIKEKQIEDLIVRDYITTEKFSKDKTKLVISFDFQRCDDDKKLKKQKSISAKNEDN